jgi:endonuclease/exonuclease/phosphatase family protein
MRIATWNCARGPWAEKLKIAQSINADVLVLTEAPKVAGNDGHHWFPSDFGQLGTTVLVSGDYTVEPLVEKAKPACVIPFRIQGPVSFTLLAVWTWPQKPYKNYKDPLIAGLCDCRNRPGPFVIAGDFNGNVRFDRPRTRLKWSTCFQEVESFDVVSAYHARFKETYGSESRPTQYQTRKRDRPFHLDYVFVPCSWQSAIRDVTVPGFEEYSRSDHRPVIVDLDRSSVRRLVDSSQVTSGSDTTGLGRRHS